MGRGCRRLCRRDAPRAQPEGSRHRGRSVIPGVRRRGRQGAARSELVSGGTALSAGGRAATRADADLAAIGPRAQGAGRLRRGGGGLPRRLGARPVDCRHAPSARTSAQAPGASRAGHRRLCHCSPIGSRVGNGPRGLARSSRLRAIRDRTCVHAEGSSRTRVRVAKRRAGIARGGQAGAGRPLRGTVHLRQPESRHRSRCDLARCHRLAFPHSAAATSGHQSGRYRRARLLHIGRLRTGRCEGPFPDNRVAASRRLRNQDAPVERSIRVDLSRPERGCGPRWFTTASIWPLASTTWQIHWRRRKPPCSPERIW